MGLHNVKLGDICKVKGGFAFKSTDFIEQGIPVIKIANILDNEVKVNNSTSYVDQRYLEKYKDFIINQGSLLIALSGATTGKFGIFQLDNKALLNQRVAMLVPDEAITTTKYLYYCLKGLQKKIFDKALGAAQPNISTKEIEEFEVMLGDINYQNRVITILDNAQALVTLRKKQIKALTSLMESVFFEMFGDPQKNEKKWATNKLLDLVEQVKRNNLKNSNNLIRYIDISSIDNTSNKIVSYTEYIGSEAPSRAQQVVFKNDILVSTVRPNLNNVALIKDDFDNLICSTGFCVIRCNEKVNRNFIFNIIKSEGFTQSLVKLTSGANYPAVKNSDVLNQEIIVPPFENQLKFSAIFEEIERQKLFLELSLNELEQNFNALMDQAFNGNILEKLAT